MSEFLIHLPADLQNDDEFRTSSSLFSRDKQRDAELISARLARIFQCALKGVLLSVGANSTRRTCSLQPVALGAVRGGNELD